MYQCPECKNQMVWVADQRDDSAISYEYHCHKCKIDLVKYVENQEVRMNLIDAYVTKVLSEPRYIDKYEDHKWWQVRVEYNSYGRLSETELTFKTEEEAKLVNVGYHFLT